MFGSLTTALAAQQPVASDLTVRPNAERVAELLARPVTVNLAGVSRASAIEVVAASAGVLVQYRLKTVERFPGTITLHLTRARLGAAIDQILAGTTLAVVLHESGKLGIVDKNMSAADSAETGSVTGEVLDSVTRKGIGQVTVKVSGRREGTVTNAEGRFTIANVPAGDYTLSIRALGFRATTRAVTITGGEMTRVRVVLGVSPNVLAGVVTTATGVQQRRQVGNDITVLNADSIMRVAPVSTITDLLETRVPGLIVMRTSGIPGAPSRLRLRGTSSPTRSNDPILIVDGVRVYANQSSGGDSVTGKGTPTYAGPSPLDQIDPNTIATVEVFKGPSASAMYGSDAGNGVIVITTKRGQAGVTRWSLSLDQGRSSLPGDWPVNRFQFGHYPAANINGSESRLCSVGDGCVPDSVVLFQALTNPRTRIFGHGMNRAASMTVSGGAGTLTYSATAGASDQLGILRLPGVEAARFERLHGFGAPDWMRRPDRYRTWNGSSRLGVQLGSSTGHLDFTNMLFHGAQQQSSLQSTVGFLQSAYVDLSQLAEQPLVRQFYNRGRLNTTTFTNAVTLSYPVLSWLPFTMTAGLNSATRDNDAVTPRNYAVGTDDSVGSYSVLRGSYQTLTLNAGTSLEIRARHRTPGVHLPVGLNFTRESQSSLAAAMTNLPAGVTEPSTFPTGPNATAPSQNTMSTSTYGWYAAPTFDLGSRLFLSPGIRFDGGTASGRNAGFSPFPKLDVSWIAIDREHDDASHAGVTLLRPRLAFGVAGVQPSPADQLRLLQPGIITPIGGGSALDAIFPGTLGNSRLRPERSRELEGGIDAEWLNQRVTIAVTAYQKMRYDAILPVLIAPSVFTSPFLDGSVLLAGGQITNTKVPINIGTVRNRGVDATVGVRLAESRLLDWSVNANVHKNQNLVLRLAPGLKGILDDLGTAGGGRFAPEARVVPGYPIFGRWARPVVSYADPDHDGIIQANDIRVADSAVYVGAQEPNYETSFATTVSLFNGRIRLNSEVDYQDGLAQFTAMDPNVSSGGFIGGLSPFDPALPLSQQALYVAAVGGETGYGLVQQVNTLRWRSLSIAYHMPSSIARRFRASSMSVALQGSNLGLHTNYRGKDPNVNANASGNAVSTTGQLPQPRVWQLHFSLGN